MAAETDSQLFAAIADGDEPTVARLLAAGADPNATDGSGWSALMRAALRRELKLASLLLAAGADPDRVYQTESGERRSALTAAPAQDAMELILAAGLSVDTRVHAAAYFLAHARSWAAKLIVDSLPKATAAVHGAGVALFDAAGSPHPGFEAALAACTPDAIRQYGGMALTNCCRSAYCDPDQGRASALVKAGADVDGGDYPSPLLQAASLHHEALVGLLISAGADPNVTDRDDVPPLGALMGFHEMHEDRRAPSRHFVAKVDRIAAALIDAGANVNAAWRDGYGGVTSVLMVATGWRPYNIRRLLEAGADPLFQNGSGWSPIHVCAVPSAAKRLKRAGADILAVTDAGDSPLLLAARAGNPAMVRWLWGFPATRSAQTKGGRSALDEARAMDALRSHEGSREVLQFLSKAR